MGKIGRLALWGAGCLSAVMFVIGAGCSSTNGSFVSDGGVGGVPDAGVMGTQDVVGKLGLDIVTGSDSLRLDSEATATIRYKDGTPDVLALPFYSDGSMTEHNFTQGSTTHLVTDLHSTSPIVSIQITLVSHPIQDLETNDSWSVQEVRASASYLSGGPATCVLDRPGKTVTDGQPLVVAAGGCNTGSLILVVVTGDDLRGDSTASVTVNYQGGVTDSQPLSKGFPGGSTVEVDLGLASNQPLDSITFAMQSHPGTFESSDNWGIKQVEALTSTGDGGTPMCILNAVGKTITDNVTLTVKAGGCSAIADGGADADTDADTDADVSDAGTD